MKLEEFEYNVWMLETKRNSYFFYFYFYFFERGKSNVSLTSFSGELIDSRYTLKSRVILYVCIL